MNTEFNSIINGRPDCFAIPVEVDLGRLECENCGSRNACFGLVLQMVEAIQNLRVPSAHRANYLRKVPKETLNCLNDPLFRKPSSCFPNELEFLVDRSINYGPKRIGPTPPIHVPMSDQEMDELLAGLGNDSTDTKKSTASTEDDLDDEIDVEAFMASLLDDPVEVVEMESSGELASTPAPKMENTQRIDITESAVVSIGSSGSGMSAIAEPTSLSELTPSTSGAFSFPMPTKRPYEHFTNKQLSDQLLALNHQAFDAKAPSGYYSVREMLCATHIEMNLRQEHAPRFRSTHDMGLADFTKPENFHESLDRQVIDIHWRAHSNDKPLSLARNYPTIFHNAPFDQEIAERFAQEKWKHVSKVVHLHLTNDMQWEHAILQGKEMQKKWPILKNGYVKGAETKETGRPQIERKLCDAMAISNNRANSRFVSGMVDAWVARRIVGDHPMQIVRMIALMTGERPRDRSAVTKSLASLDANLLAYARAKKIA
jgi:hypothetical protein